MTEQEIEELRDSLRSPALRFEVQELAGFHKKPVKLTARAYDRNGLPFVIYAYQVKQEPKIYLTDLGLITGSLQKSGLGVDMKLLQALVSSYGLMLTQEGMVVEDNDRPMWERTLAMFQAWCAADGVMRTWARG